MIPLSRLREIEDAIHRGMWGAYTAYLPALVFELLEARGEVLKTKEEVLLDMQQRQLRERLR